MQGIEIDFISLLRKEKSTVGYVDLLIASQIIGSQSLQKEALDMLINSSPVINVEQAKRIGAENTPCAGRKGYMPVL